MFELVLFKFFFFFFFVFFFIFVKTSFATYLLGTDC